jgi:hypothetical protein
MEAWRNGSALDSSPKGCVFDSRRFHFSLFVQIFQLQQASALVFASVALSALFASISLLSAASGEA